MWTDPIVEETRRLREEHAKRFNYDLRAIFEDLKRFEQLQCFTNRFAPSEIPKCHTQSRKVARKA